MIEGSGSVSLTNGSGSGRPKNLWILRIRIRKTAGIALKVSTSTWVVCMMVRSLSCPKPGPILPRIPAVPNSKRGAIIRCSSGKAACSASCATICRVSLFSSQANQSSTNRCNGGFVGALRMRGAKSFNFVLTQHLGSHGSIPKNNSRQGEHESYDWKHHKLAYRNEGVPSACYRPRNTAKCTEN